MFYIRADANSQIGSGHIMRCMAIAEQMRRRGREVTFLVANKESEALLEKQSFPSIVLHADWSNLESELEILLTLIKEKSIKTLFIDSYFVTQKYLNRLKQQVTLFYLDDIKAFDYPVDLLVNYSITSKKREYEQLYTGELPSLLLGAEYVPLRAEFLSTQAKEIKKQVKHILVTTGGADQYNLSAALVEAAEKLKLTERFYFHIISGKMNQYVNELKQIGAANKAVYIYENATNMSELMKKCDIAISAGGTTLYELCAVGIPTLCFTVAENQVNGAKGLHAKKAMQYVGDIQEGKAQLIEELIKGIERYQADWELRKTTSEIMQHIIDGQGAERIAQAMLSFEKGAMLHK